MVATRELDRRTVLQGAAALAAMSATTSRAQAANATKVAILLDDDATVIDFAGPWEVFNDATGLGAPNGYRMFTVAPSKTLVRVSGGLSIQPDYAFDDAPQPDILVMGAQGNGDNPAKLAWIRKVFPGTTTTMSVCTGAYVLARTGLLDGRRATTHHEFFDDFEKKFSKIALVRGPRFVDEGKLLTGGGLSSGIDAALHVVERMHGRALAVKTATYLEYRSPDWS